MNEVFGANENIRTNTRNGYFKLNHRFFFFEKTVQGKGPISYWTCYLEQKSRKF